MWVTYCCCYPPMREVDSAGPIEISDMHCYMHRSLYCSRHRLLTSCSFR